MYQCNLKEGTLIKEASKIIKLTLFEVKGEH